jgi:hypothetical protein
MNNEGNRLTMQGSTTRSVGAFITDELSVYIGQIFMFFIVAIVTSNILRNSNELIVFMNSRINSNSIYDIIATMIAIAATVGVVAAVTKAAPKSSLLEHLADEMLAEAPRTIYVFGSSVAASLFAAAIYLGTHNEPNSPSITKLIVIAILFAIVAFAYGCAFAYAFKHKAFIKNCKS